MPVFESDVPVLQLGAQVKACRIPKTSTPNAVKALGRPTSAPVREISLSLSKYWYSTVPGAVATGARQNLTNSNVRVPALLSFSVSEDSMVGVCDCIATESNVINISTLGGSDTVLYSMDIYHKPFSTADKSSKEDLVSRAMFGSARMGNTIGNGTKGGHQELVRRLNEWAQRQGQIEHSGRKGYTYSLESLRKRGNEEEM